MKAKAIFLSLLCVLFLQRTQAVQVSIAKDGRDAVLSWQSSAGEKFMIQQRPDFNTNSVWSTLTNLYPAATGTNVTTYRLVNVFPPANTNISQSGGGGSSNGPPVFSMSAGSSTSSSDSATAAKSKKAIAFPPLPGLPPIPWDQSTWGTTSPQLTTLNSLEPMGEGEGTGVTMGFFRVIGIPDFKNNISGALFDNNYFVTMRFVEPEERFDLVELLINGQPTTQMARYSQVSGTNYYTGIIIYADRLTNGANTLQLRSTFRIEDVSSSDSPEVVLSNAVVSVVFSNVTTFPTWPDIAIGDSITLEAKTVHPIAAWQLDIYDSDDLWVKSLAGETTNGSISVEWNLRDNNNNSRNTLESDPFFYSEMTVLPLASPGGSASGASTTRPTPFIANDFPNRGAWLTAYLDRDKRTAGPNPQFQGRDMATNLWTAPWALADYPILFAFLPYANNTNRSDMTNQAPRNAAWETLRGNLYDRSTRNFYYTGHGTKSLLGADWDDPTVDILKATGIINPAGSRANLSSQWLRDNVTFNKYGANRYRFVFLDGCQTSTGDWPIAFGIPKQTNNLAYYVALNANKNTRSASRPSAFVGWEVVVGGSALWGNTTTAAAFRKSWIGLWGNTFNAPSVSQSLIDGNNNAGWISETLLKDSLRVYGYTALRFRDYNRKTDWPPTP